MNRVTFVAAGLLALACAHPAHADPLRTGSTTEAGNWPAAVHLAAVSCNRHGCREIKNPNCRVVNVGGKAGGNDRIVCDKKKS